MGIENEDKFSGLKAQCMHHTMQTRHIKQHLSYTTHSVPLRNYQHA